MKTLKLTGKTMKGKNRVREHGQLWVVHAETQIVLFNPEPGPWLFVAPVGKDFQDKSSRWIHAVDDKDFIVEQVS